MTYIDQLRQIVREQAATGYMNWDLIDEIKRLARMNKIYRKLRKMVTN